MDNEKLDRDKLKKIKKYLISGIPPIIIANYIAMGFVIAGLLLFAVVGGYSALQKEQELTEEEINIQKYGCPCGDCSHGIEYIGDTGLTNGEEDNGQIGGDFSKTHSGDSFSFKDGAIAPELNAESTKLMLESYKLWRGFGYSHEATVAILANGIVESHYEEKIWSAPPKREPYGERPGTTNCFGIWQTQWKTIKEHWLPYLEPLNKDVNTLDAQVHALDHSLREGHESKCMQTYAKEGYKITMEEFMQLDDPILACDYFCVCYERCVTSDPVLGQRAITGNGSKGKPYYQGIEKRKKLATELMAFFEQNMTVDNTGNTENTENKEESKSQQDRDASGIANRVESTIYIGDSRFNGMETHLKKGEGFVIAKDSMGYDWFMGEGLQRVNQIKQQNSQVSKWTIVSGLGVNDLHNINKYIQAYKDLESKGDRVVVLSVNPTDGNRSSLNTEIDKFNSTMSTSGFEYIDTCGMLRTSGFETVDGVHYNKNTYLKIWNEINDYLVKNTSSTNKPSGESTSNTGSKPSGEGNLTQGGMTIPSKGELDASIGQYGIPIWTGYSKSDDENTVMVPVETDNRTETKIAQAASGVFAPDTLTVAQRGASAVVSTEHTTGGNCQTYNGRLGVAVASGLIAWHTDPDHDSSMIGVEIDVVLNDGHVIPCVVKDAKANVHSGDLHMYYTGGYGRKQHGEGYWLPPDYSFIELFYGTKQGGNYVAQQWLKEYSRAAGGISHIKVYGHLNKQYALQNNGKDPSNIKSSGTSVVPQPGNGVNSGVKSSVTLTYNKDNVDLPDWQPGQKLAREYDITECKPIESHPHLLTGKATDFSGPIDSFVVHYMAGASKSGDNLFNWFQNNVNASSNFSIGLDGVLWQFQPLDKAGWANNDNANRLSVEVANYEDGDKYNYSKEAYETLVHLAAWITVKYNLSTDFKWDSNGKNNYRDIGNIHRHYDNSKNGKFRGKTCPAYWTPADGSSETPSRTNEGGNARWIAFKEDVTEFIIKYRNDPNFEIKGIVGTESIERFKQPLDNANWSNGYLVPDNGSTIVGEGGSIEGYRGKVCGCKIPCDKCDCHNEEFNQLKDSGKVQEDGSATPGVNKYYDGYTDGLKLEGVTRKEKGEQSAEGILYDIVDGVLVWKGDTWQSVVIPAKAREVMMNYHANWAAKASMYSQGRYIEIGYGIPGGSRYDCSGFISTLVFSLGYPIGSTRHSSFNYGSLGFEVIPPRTYAYQSGDIVAKYSGHIGLFIQWTDDSHSNYWTYDFGCTKFINDSGPDFYEPTVRYVSDMVKGFRPYPIDCVINGKTIRADHWKEDMGNASAAGGKEDTKKIDKLDAGSIISEEIPSSELDDYFVNYEINEGDKVYQRIKGKSFPDNHPGIELSDLRYIKLLHYNYSGQVQVGELIVNKSIADDIIKIFKELYNNKYQIEKMHLIDKYWDGNKSSEEIDTVSMTDNNSSAFNYRLKTNGQSLSKHGSGLAIDINTLQNPYVGSDGVVTPPNGAEYANRSDKKEHMIDENDLAVITFKKYGFTWGGDWNSLKDYQHFEK